MKNKKWIILISAIMVLALVAGCSSSGGGGSKKEITLAYVAWDSEIASTNVVREVLEQKLGYKVTMLQVDASPMWAGIANGSADAMVAAWLPTTHADFAEMNKGKYEDLGVNLTGTKLGLVVPQYMDIDSIEDLKNDDVAASLNHTITGIEPGAGMMATTAVLMDEYGLTDKWTLLESSSAAMTQELERAYAAKEPIVVTGWTPHWKFAKMDLKYLDDPKEIYGKAEEIHTIARLDLEKDQPEAYKFLKNFNWEPADMEKVMIDIADGATPEAASKKWVDENTDKVDAWLK
ncbi:MULTISPECIES: glycine betaine ABC transporter substrate-binding protein [unclassified Paenibacillus]|uniref:glycine betaine ABC transporter substrate-binding protein n=1 Tax=unclassified Paenibacillus TaxID=185978 RepID=UPI002F3F27C1